MCLESEHAFRQGFRFLRITSCTEVDRYVPVVEIGEYEQDCIRLFMEVFPDSKLNKQIAAGEQVTHNTIKLPVLPCASAKNAQKCLKSLSDFVVAHERDTYDHFSGREAPIGGHISGFSMWREGIQVVPRMDLWEQWWDENLITAADLYNMMILSSAQPDKYPYLVQCGKYVCDVFGNGFEKPVTYRYADHIQRIVYALLRVTVPLEQQHKIALAFGIWIAHCLPEEMFIGDSGQKTMEQPKNPAGEMIVHYADAQVQLNMDARRQLNAAAGHFITHPQFSALVNQIDPSNSSGLQYRIPVLLNIYERTYASTNAYMECRGMTPNGKITMLLNMIYMPCYRLQQPVKLDVSIYLYARHHSLISDRTLYYHLMDSGNFKTALQLITSVCAMEPKDGNQVSSRTFQTYHSYGIRRSYEEFIGKDVLPREEQDRLVALCHQTADKLVPVVVGAELLRGDTPTDYSAYVTGIHVLSGMETFVRILSALGKDSLDRSVYYWGSSHSKRGNLSYLLARCAPQAGDDAEKLAKLLKGTDITEKRLIEAALYSPAWIDIIGEYLNLPGFKSACYYFMAHMNEKFDEQKKAIIARFTPLSEDELNLGAFDVKWFHAAYEQLGEKKFDLIYDAAKYISDGSKHTRARKYADAALGRLKVDETETTIKDKRNKDLLMAYAIIPLAGEDDLITCSSS